MRIFKQEEATRENTKRNDINFTELFGLNDYIAPIEEFPEPFITCCFVEDHLIFVQIFHNISLTHYHFYWHTRERRVIAAHDYDERGNRKFHDKPITHDFSGVSKTNFPVKCFYS